MPSPEAGGDGKASPEEVFVDADHLMATVDEEGSGSQDDENIEQGEEDEDEEDDGEEDVEEEEEDFLLPRGPDEDREDDGTIEEPTGVAWEPLKMPVVLPQRRFAGARNAETYKDSQSNNYALHTSAELIISCQPTSLGHKTTSWCPDLTMVISSYGQRPMQI